jgi:hypothetical protein
MVTCDTEKHSNKKQLPHLECKAKFAYNASHLFKGKISGKTSAYTCFLNLNYIVAHSGLVIVFTDCLLLETTNQYNTLICFHTTNHYTLDLLSLLSLIFLSSQQWLFFYNVFTIRFLATHFNTGTITVTLQISLYYNTYKVFKSHVISTLHRLTFKSQLNCTQ